MISNPNVSRETSRKQRKVSIIRRTRVVTHFLFGESRVDHEHDAVDGKRRLCDVGRHDTLPPDGAVWSPRRGGLENPLQKKHKFHKSDVEASNNEIDCESNVAFLCRRTLSPAGGWVAMWSREECISVLRPQVPSSLLRAKCVCRPLQFPDHKVNLPFNVIHNANGHTDISIHERRPEGKLTRTYLLTSEKEQNVSLNFFTHVNLNHCSDGRLQVISLWLRCVEDLHRVCAPRHAHQRRVVEVVLQTKTQFVQQSNVPGK